MTRAPAATVVALLLGGCGGGAATHATLPPAGPFFADRATVRSYLTRAGVAVSRFGPASAPSSVVPHASSAYSVATRGGTRVRVLIYRSANMAMRAQASAGPLTALGDNVLAVVGRRGRDIYDVRAAITAIGDCRSAQPCPVRR
jgi:hypothetical protein